jgi:hypothetical protein
LSVIFFKRKSAESRSHAPVINRHTPFKQTHKHTNEQPAGYLQGCQVSSWLAVRISPKVPSLLGSKRVVLCSTWPRTHGEMLGTERKHKN